MKKTLLIVAIALSGYCSHAQFSTGGNPTTTMDNVGIGTATPTLGKLQVNSQLDSQGPDALTLYNTNQAGSTQSYNFITATGNSSSVKFRVSALGDLTAVGQVIL